MKDEKSDIYLRKFEEKDLETSYKYINDAEINEIMGYLPVSYEEQVNWYKSTIGNNSKFIFAICTKNNDEYIGNVGLGKIDYIHRNAMLSIFIWNKKLRNKGLGTKAVELALDFAFNRLNLHKVTVQTSVAYPPLGGCKASCIEGFGVISFYQKLGFIKEGILREQNYKYGKYIDKYLLGILKNEYIKRKTN